MIPRPFAFLAPSSEEEVLEVLERDGPGAQLLAGGQSLLREMKGRRVAPKLVIDLGHLPGLSYVRETEEHLALGALTRIHELRASTLLEDRYPLLAEATRELADPLVRNVGTVGGNVALGFAGNDLACAAVAADATFILRSRSGRREVSARQFYQGPLATARRPTELLTEVRFPRATPHERGSYEKAARRVSDYALAAVGVRLVLRSEGTIAQAGISIANSGPITLWAQAAGERLVGTRGSPAHLGDAARIAAQAVVSAPDPGVPLDYQRAVVRGLVDSALARAIATGSGVRA